MTFDIGVYVVLLTGFLTLSLLALRTSRHPEIPLPKNLTEWRHLSDEQSDNDNEGDTSYQSAWDQLRPVLSESGLHLWKSSNGVQMLAGDLPTHIGSFFIGRDNQVGNFNSFVIWNGLSHAASRRCGDAYVLRIVTAGGQGQSHLRLLRRLSFPQDILKCDNHILPMVKEIAFEDVTIGVFPRLSWDMNLAISGFVQNSVEDIIHMILQALEGTAYIHKMLIGHRDLFLNNLLVEWVPESMSHGPPLTKPRVYIIDFEHAVDFSDQVLENDRLCADFPFSLQAYGRPFPLEIKNGDPYCPFKLDMWQLGFSLKTFCHIGIPDIDQLWDDLSSEMPESRPTASEALKRLQDYVRSVPPSDLHTSVIQS